MYTRPVDPTLEWIEQKFSSRPQVRDANLAAFKAGLHFGETAELFEHPTRSSPRSSTPVATATSPATSRWPTA